MQTPIQTQETPIQTQETPIQTQETPQTPEQYTKIADCVRRMAGEIKLFVNFAKEMMPSYDFDKILSAIDSDTFNISEALNDTQSVEGLVTEIMNNSDNLIFSYLREHCYPVNWAISYLENIRKFESIIAIYDNRNRYHTFDTFMHDKSMCGVTANLGMLCILPISVCDKIIVLQDSKLSISALRKLPTEKFRAIYERMILLHKYITINIRIINKLIDDIENQSDSQFTINSEDKEKLFDEVKKGVNKYGSECLNTTLNEILSELNDGPCKIENIVSGGMSTVTSGKVLRMAKKVADSLTQKINSEEMDVKELADSSKVFINDIIDSEMFKNHPNSGEIKKMFSSLMETVENLSEAYTENKDGEIIDKMLLD